MYNVEDWEQDEGFAECPPNFVADTFMTLWVPLQIR